MEVILIGLLLVLMSPPTYVILGAMLVLWIFHREAEHRPVVIEAFPVAIVATLTSLSYGVKVGGSLCIVCTSNATVRGWPFAWAGLQGLDACFAPLAFAANLLAWWAVIVLSLKLFYSVRPRFSETWQRVLSPLVLKGLLAGAPLLFLLRSATSYQPWL